MEISRFKIAVKFLTGGPSGALDYVLDCANSFAAKLQDARKDEIAAALDTGKKVLATMDAVSWLVPKRWLNAYTLTVSAFADLVDALSDLSITRDELSHVVDAFRVAYAAWRAD